MNVECRYPRRIGALTLILMALVFSATAFSQKDGPRGEVVSAYSHTDEGPGKMHLLPGYVAGLPQGSHCIDSECGYIRSPQGLSINYDIGGLAGPGLSPKRTGQYDWYGEAKINGQVVRYAVSGDDPEFLEVSFPASFANFQAKVRNEDEIQTALRMLLTFHGEGFEADAKGYIDACLIGRNGSPLAAAEVTLRGSSYTQTSQIDDEGHVRWSGVPAGHYELRVASAVDCSGPPKAWKIRAEPAQILLRTLAVRCR